jgi:DNA repair exonuclease SbcCD ATPase subunit
MGMKSSRDGTSNLLMENEDLRKENSGQFDWMQEQITLLLQEVQAKTELVDIQQKQIGDLLQALVKSNCENTRLTSEHNKCMEEQGDVNTLQAELEQAQEENQKLQKELSTKLTDLKNLHIMFSTLGREKEIMAAELALKARLLGDMEEHLNDLKEQNKTLSNKLEAYARENKTKNRDT